MDSQEKGKSKKSKEKKVIDDDSSDSYATDNQLDDKDYSPTEDIEDSEKNIAKEHENIATKQSSIAVQSQQNVDGKSKSSSSTRMSFDASDEFLKICLKEFENIRNMKTGNAINFEQSKANKLASWTRIQAEFTKVVGVSRTF